MSIDLAQQHRIREAEIAWCEASVNDERRSIASTRKAEQDAWDVYAQLCAEAQVCLQPRCFVHSLEQAWCSEHGAK
jgi:hypothetical protein